MTDDEVGNGGAGGRAVAREVSLKSAGTFAHLDRGVVSVDADDDWPEVPRNKTRKQSVDVCSHNVARLLEQKYTLVASCLHGDLHFRCTSMSRVTNFLRPVVAPPRFESSKAFLSCATAPYPEPRDNPLVLLPTAPTHSLACTAVQSKS